MSPFMLILMAAVAILLVVAVLAVRARTRPSEPALPVLPRAEALSIPPVAAPQPYVPPEGSVMMTQLEVGQTFYDFVNGYRVREVQRRIKAGEARALKMLALAMDAGFASKSTFNQAFKKHTSQTPSDFRQAVGA